MKWSVFCCWPYTVRINQISGMMKTNHMLRLSVESAAGGVQEAGRRPLARKRAHVPRCLPVKEPKAFTLIELLVVISVIAVLMGILLPILGRVRKQAQSVRCQANLKHLGMAVAVYVADEGTFPRQPAFELSMFNVPRMWEQLLNHMDIDDKQDIMLCPVAKRTADKQHLIRSKLYRISGGTYHAWWRGGYHDIPEMRGSYAYNHFLYRVGYYKEAPSYPWFVDPAQVKQPSTVPMMLDSQWLQSVQPALGPPLPPPPHDNWALREPRVGSFYSCINRHHGSVNAIFVDSSVRKVGLKELWTLNWHRRFDTANKWTTAGGVQPEDWPEWMRGFKDY